MSSGKAALLFIATGILGFAQQANEKIEFFEARVRPVLAANCYACHTDSKLGGLRVDSSGCLHESRGQSWGTKGGGSPTFNARSPVGTRTQLFPVFAGL